MNNEGRIVVFMSMISGVFLILITLVLQVVTMSVAESKAVVASRMTVSDIKTYYNSYIFEHYHILLFDKTMEGQGEAYLEELMQTYYCEKLGEAYDDTDVKLGQFTMLCDNACQAFRDQMKEHVLYACAEKAAQTGVDYIVEKTDGKDGTLPEDLQEDIKDAQETEKNRMDMSENAQTDDEDTADGISKKTEVVLQETEEDPREYTKKLSSSAILNLVLPDDDKSVSGAAIQMEDFPSRMHMNPGMAYEEIDRTFDDLTGMQVGLVQLATWQDALADSGAMAVYIGDVFNCFTKTANDTAGLSYEQEYLIAGKSTDYENLKSVAHRMIGIRFPINYISLCGQADKMTKLTTMATSIAGAAPYLIPAIKYLLAGCWAYIEAIADVRVLFAGKKASFVKNSENWITDINHISESLSKEIREDENGLDYQAYLTILQMLNRESVMYRMLDLIQFNARQESPSFLIRNAATGLQADFQTTYKGKTFSFHQSGSY